MIGVLVAVLGRPPYNDSDVLQLEQSDSSSDATASCSATCSSSDTAVSDNQRLVAPAAPASTRSLVAAYLIGVLSPSSPKIKSQWRKFTTKLVVVTWAGDMQGRSSRPVEPIAGVEFLGRGSEVLGVGRSSEPPAHQ